ncbi:MAG TPA: hypothetical protein VJK52_03685, partial [Candidatus Nanoarchaeia archaeon]|nr:hypothetical protein [Candidatus Nanoarchaeia archaeon]
NSESLQVSSQTFLHAPIIFHLFTFRFIVIIAAKAAKSDWMLTGWLRIAVKFKVPLGNNLGGIGYKCSFFWTQKIALCSQHSLLISSAFSSV